MPKSKRAKVFHLTKTKKKGRSIKEKMVGDVRECCDNFERCFVFRTVNCRNNGLKELRNKLGDSRMFMGKNKVMALALGKSPEEEHRDNTSQVSKHLTGGCGLLFTNLSPEEVAQQIMGVDDLHFARSGFVATQDFELKGGEVPMPFSMETQLRKLGLPTLLKHGKIILAADTAVCRKGDTLTPEQCKLLEMFGVKMARFRAFLTCRWERESCEFEDLDLPEWAAEADTMMMDTGDGFF